MADVHLGAYTKEFRELNLQAFLATMDRCIERKVDLIMIAGDLFHINVPDLAVVDRAAAKLREVKDAGIPVYVWYGSHDYSPTEKSIIDVLASAGLFTKVSTFEAVDGQGAPRFEWTQDPATGVRMVAIAGKALGLDMHVFKALDRAALEREDGFKVFGFHAAVKEYLPAYLAHINGVSLDDFPRGFDYYAGGHIHHTSIEDPAGYGPFVNPGPTFGSDGRDLLNDEPRGFVVGTVRTGRVEVAFERVEVVPYLREEFDVTGKTAAEARAAIESRVAAWDVGGKAVVVRVRGELASGRRAELDLDGLHTRLPKLGARAVHIVKSYSVRESERVPTVEGETQADVERKVVEAKVAAFASRDVRFTGPAGADLALALKRVLSEEPPAQRGGKSEYQERVVQQALELLGLAGEPPTAPAERRPSPTEPPKLEEYA
jgi:DNA repair exonuclease SbcCD nuclease subunit